MIPSSGKSELEVEASDLRGLVDSISRDLGDSFRVPLYDTKGQPRPYSMVYHNGTAYKLRDASNVQLKEGDTVFFVPSVGGG